MSTTPNEPLHKELDLIQAVVTRMVQNAFYVKGWSVTLVAVLLALGKDHLLTRVQTPNLLGLVLLVWCAFWFLDAYFLRQERMYRKLYEFVILHPNDPNRLRYNLDATPYRDQTPTEWRLMGSITLGVFYGIPAALLFFILILTRLS